MGLVLEHEEAKTGNRCPCLLPEWGWASPLNEVRVAVAQWVQLEEWLRWSAGPLGGAVCRGHA